MLQQPGNTDGYCIRLVIARVVLLTDELRERFCHDVFLGELVVGDELLNSLRMNLVKHASAQRPCVQICHTDDFVQNLDYAGVSRATLFVQRLLADEFSRWIQREIPAQLMRDLGKNFAVALAFRRVLVIDIAFLLYGDLAAFRVIPKVRETGAPKGEIAGDDIGIGMDQFAHVIVTPGLVQPVYVSPVAAILILVGLLFSYTSYANIRRTSAWPRWSSCVSPARNA